MISILCADARSNYFKIEGLDIYDQTRDAYNFASCNKVIAHPPCAQWSRLKSFASSNQREKDLAVFCFEKVNANGGIFEHPAGSSFFKFIGADFKKITSVNQSWWNFPSRKTTYLYCSQVKLLAFPLPGEIRKLRCTSNLHSQVRSIMTLEFCQYLVNSINS